VYQETTPTWPGRVRYLNAAHGQRWAHLVASDSIGEPAQLDTHDVPCVGGRGSAQIAGAG